MQLKTQQSGFTLLEVLVYIAIFAIIMTAALAGTFQIITSSVDIREYVVLEQEANFVFRKIDWALNGEVINVNAPNPETLFVDKPGISNYEFKLDGDAIVLNDEPLTSSAVKVTNFAVTTFTNPPAPEGVSVTFELNGREFASALRYVRQ